MTVYVDPLNDWGWILRGRFVPSCHMFTDQVDLTELHDMAAQIGMRRAWFQDKPDKPHYDLTPSRRAAALACGAKPVEFAEAYRIWRARRAAVGS